VVHGIPQEYLQHAKRDAILERIGLTPQAVALDTLARLGALEESVSPLDETVDS
jgi:1-deoxy-D-xylulose-5-phosphate synthase